MLSHQSSSMCLTVSSFLESEWLRHEFVIRYRIRTCSQKWISNLTEFLLLFGFFFSLFFLSFILSSLSHFEIIFWYQTVFQHFASSCYSILSLHFWFTSCSRVALHCYTFLICNCFLSQISMTEKVFQLA